MSWMSWMSWTRLICWIRERVLRELHFIALYGLWDGTFVRGRAN